MAPKSGSTRTASSAVHSLAALAALVAMAAAADEPKDPSPSATRITVEKDKTTTRVVTEQDVSVKLEIAAKPSASCAATIDVEYQQRDAVVRATGAIENDQCAASGGDYVLAVTIRAANGEVKTLEFPQQWQRSDDKPVKFTHDLPVGQNVDLVNVRPRRLRCTCTEVTDK